MAMTMWDEVKKTLVCSRLCLSVLGLSKISRSSETNSDGDQAHHPGPLAFLHLLVKEERNQSDEQIDERELMNGSFHVHDALLGEFEEVVRGIGFVVLPAAQGVEESFHGAGIAPVQWRVRHRGQRHVKIECRAR